MTKKQDQVTLDEILRRIAVARTLLPESIACQPQEQTWDMLAACLVNDDKIFGRVEAMVADKKRGRPKSDAEAAKHPTEKLVELADAFDKYAAKLRQDAERNDVPTPVQEKLIASFLGKHAGAESRFSWLRTSKGVPSVGNVTKLIQQGRRMRKWPRRCIKGRTRILHPAQWEAYKALLAAPLCSDEVAAQAENAILSLRYDRDGDLDEIKNLQMLYTLRRHAIWSMFGGPPLPLLKRIPEEIRDE